MARQSVQSRFGRFQRDARRHPEHRAEDFRIALMRYVSGEFRDHGFGRSAWREDVRRRDGDGAEKILGADADDGCGLAIDVNRAANGVWIGVHAIAPEAVAQEDDRRRSWAVDHWIEST